MVSQKPWGVHPTGKFAGQTPSGFGQSDSRRNLKLFLKRARLTPCTRFYSKFEGMSVAEKPIIK
jgi:hypothetical protein